MADRCRSCQAEIIWAVTTKGNAVPLDVAEERRMVFVTADDTKRIAERDSVLDGDAKTVRLVPTFTNHFATCPDAESWRKKKGEPSG
jgi:hypothetical protein